MSPSPVDSTEASETRLLDDNFFIFFLKCGSRSIWRGKTLGFLRRRWRETDEVEEERKSLRLEFFSLESVNCCRVRLLNTFPVINMSTAGEDRGFRQLFVCLRKKRWSSGCSVNDWEGVAATVCKHQQKTQVQPLIRLNYGKLNMKWNLYYKFVLMK